MSVSEESLINAEGTAMKPSRKISERFRAGDANVTFVSSDNIAFQIHGKNLEFAAAGFPPAGFDVRGEEVALTEDSATLELLFQFVYPQRHPDLEFTPFDTLAPLAEAAEKYEVFSAMNICKIRMKNILPDHSVEIFNYASKHDYTDILSFAAPFMLDIPLDEIVKTLAVHLLGPWVCYWQAWSRAAHKAIMSLPPLYRMETMSSKRRCSNCDSRQFSDTNSQLTPAHLWMMLGEKRSRDALEGVYVNINAGEWTPFNRLALRVALDKELAEVPGFDMFI